jgi:hypothetical protein
VKPVDGRKVGVRERHAERLDFLVNPHLQFGEGGIVHWCAFDIGDDFVEICGAPPALWSREGPAEQQGEILGATVRHREKRLEQEVEQKVVATQIDDERDGWLDLRDIRKILVGPHADIGAAAHTRVA